MINQNFQQILEKNLEKKRDKNFLKNYYPQIRKILSYNCFLCGKNGSDIIHHINYGNYPKNFNEFDEKEKLKILKNYCDKNFLIFCSTTCHMKYHKKVGMIKKNRDREETKNLIIEYLKENEKSTATKLISILDAHYYFILQILNDMQQKGLIIKEVDEIKGWIYWRLKK